MLGGVVFSADKTFGQAAANIPAPIIHRCSVLIRLIFGFYRIRMYKIYSKKTFVITNIKENHIPF